MNKILPLLLLFVLFDASAARIDTLTISSPRLPEPMEVRVVVPDVKTPGKVPVVYLLNGYDGDSRQWLSTAPELPGLADRWGMLLVFPSGMDSWYADSPMRKDMQMESFIIKELLPEIDRRYPTDTSRRAITGLSMGGHGALTLAMAHPDLFLTAGSTSGGVDLRPFVKRWNLQQIFGTDLSGRSAIERVPGLSKKAPHMSFIIDCGASDFFAEVNENLHRALLEEGVPHIYTSRPGVHSHAYWRESIPRHLRYFNTVFNREENK